MTFDPRAETGIPTEPAGSLPRPAKLQTAFAAYDAGEITKKELEAEQEIAIKDSIEKFEATGSPIIADGEQWWSSFATYPFMTSMAGSGLNSCCGPGGQTFALFPDGHYKSMPKLVGGPFQYNEYAGDSLAKSIKFAKKPMKQAVIAPSMLSLLLPLHCTSRYRITRARPTSSFSARSAPSAAKRRRRNRRSGAAWSTTASWCLACVRRGADHHRHPEQGAHLPLGEPGGAKPPRPGASGRSANVLGEIRAFCRETQTAESTFGRRVVNDGKLVSRLRDGARITTDTLSKVRTYLSVNRVEQNLDPAREPPSRLPPMPDPTCCRPAFASSTTARNTSCSSRPAARRPTSRRASRSSSPTSTRARRRCACSTPASVTAPCSPG